MIEVQWIGALARIESLPDEIGLGIFERGRHIGLRSDPKKKRTSVGGQARGEMTVQLGKVELAFANDGSHAGTAFRPRNRDSVDAGMLDAFKCAEFLRHLGGGHVLALPAKGIADAVHE